MIGLGEVGSKGWDPAELERAQRSYQGGNLIGPAPSLWFEGLNEWPHGGVGCLKTVAFLAGSSIFQALS